MAQNNQIHFIVAGSSNQKLAQKISDSAHIKLADVHLSRFPNQELQVRINTVPDKAFLIQSLSAPVNSHIVELLLLANGLEEAGTKEIIGIIPWFGYSKQDKAFLKGEPVSAKVIANLIQTTAITKLIAVDLHSRQIEKYFKIPLINLKAQPLLQKQVSTILRPDSVIISPDTGAIDTAVTYAQQLDRPLVKLKKHRHLKTGDVIITSTTAKVKNAHCIIVDDLIATGGTLIKTAKFLFDQKAASVSVAATHHLYIDGVQERLDQSGYKHTIVTDSVQKPKDVTSKTLQVVSISGLISQTLT